jgi:hypothetical protein
MKKRLAIVLVVLALALSIGAAYAWAVTSDSSSAGVAAACSAPKPAMHLYMDTHDKKDGTFPASITPAQLNAFYVGYAAAMQSEGVVVVRTYVNAAQGRAFCITMAPSVDAVRRAHVKAGLMYDSITEVYGVAPSDLLLNE